MFMRRLELEIGAACKDGSALSVAIFDIDHFKKVNDRHGHAVGDSVLERIARVAAASAGPANIVGRLGGEEFAILIPGADAMRAAELGERVRATIETDTSAAPPLPAVTISVGIASLQDGRVSSSLLAAADAALYEAKRTKQAVLRRVRHARPTFVAK